MTEYSINVGTDFSRIPGGRYVRHGEFSGEAFRSEVLAPALRKFDHVTVNLDGTVGYSGSFIEEAFGGLLRDEGFSAEDIDRQLTITCSDQRYALYVRMAQQYIREAANRGSARVA